MSFVVCFRIRRELPQSASFVFVCKNKCCLLCAAAGNFVVNLLPGVDTTCPHATSRPGKAKLQKGSAKHQRPFAHSSSLALCVHVSFCCLALASGILGTYFRRRSQLADNPPSCFVLHTSNRTLPDTKPRRAPPTQNTLLNASDERLLLFLCLPSTTTSHLLLFPRSGLPSLLALVKHHRSTTPKNHHNYCHYDQNVVFLVSSVFECGRHAASALCRGKDTA